MNALRAIRRAAGLTQSELGQKLGIAQSTVAHLETRDPASGDVIARVLDELPREMRRARVSLEALVRMNRPSGAARSAASSRRGRAPR